MDKNVYDRNGRIKYNSTLHPNHGKSYTVADLDYLCEFYELDGRKAVASALGRIESTIAALVHQLRKEGKFEYYKNLNKNR